MRPSADCASRSSSSSRRAWTAASISPRMVQRVPPAVVRTSPLVVGVTVVGSSSVPALYRAPGIRYAAPPTHARQCRGVAAIIG